MLLRSAALRSLVVGASDAIYVVDSDGALLMANPADVTEEHRLVAEVVRREKLAARGEIVGGVRDSGSGIAPAHLPHIFNPFYTTKPRGIGTGLGRSISDGIVRGHDGTLRVQSELGAGALFEVILPVVSPPVPVPV